MTDQAAENLGYLTPVLPPPDSNGIFKHADRFGWTAGTATIAWELDEALNGGRTQLETLGNPILLGKAVQSDPISSPGGHQHLGARLFG